MAYNYSIYVISALCGNAWRESTINSGLQQVGGTAFGMFQWDGTRKTSLLQWLSDNGYSNNSPQGQLDYLIVENDWQGSFNGISSLTDFLTSTSTDIPMLTEAFMRCWERPGVPALSDRIEYANKCYTYILQNYDNTDIAQWYASSSYLTEQQSLNNAVMLYRYYSDERPHPPIPPKKKKKMPIWMMIRYHY